MYWCRAMGRCEWVEFEINMLAMKQSEVDATGGPWTHRRVRDRLFG